MEAVFRTPTKQGRPATRAHSPLPSSPSEGAGSPTTLSAMLKAASPFSAAATAGPGTGFFAHRDASPSPVPQYSLSEEDVTARAACTPSSSCAPVVAGSPLAAPDRYIASRASQDPALSRYLLTTSEATTPLDVLAQHQQLRHQGDHSTGFRASPFPSSQTPLRAQSTPHVHGGGGGGGEGRGFGGGAPFASRSAPREDPFTSALSHIGSPSHEAGVASFATPHRHGSLAGGSGLSPSSPLASSPLGTTLRAAMSSLGRAGSPGLSDVLAKLHLEGSGLRGAGGTVRDGGSRRGSRARSPSADGDSPPVTLSGSVTSTLDIEPYTSKLARTLFSDALHTTVLGLHHSTAAGAGGAKTAAAAVLGEREGSNTLLSSARVAKEHAAPAPPSSPPFGIAGAVSEEARYTASLGVVFENNRARNFRSRSYRVIPQTPERILDAAEMVDDFYLNLVDWSVSDVLCVALQRVVYLWDAATCDITQLPESRPTESHTDTVVCGVNWALDGRHLAVGLNSGGVDVWDVETQQVVRSWSEHRCRVGSLSWTTGDGTLLASGSKDSTIRLQDMRERVPVSVLRGHSQEVCGLRWCPHNNAVHLASGGNDNQLLVWDRRLISTGAGTSSFTSFADEEAVDHAGGSRPVLYLNQHVAAVKAIAWNPVVADLLASGGGTDDKTLRFWNTGTGDCVRYVNTQSQVCGVLWSHAGNELVSSHGFSLNQLTIWRYPSLRRVADLTGHTSRVLHLCMSTDGQTVVSAAGDETIRFWRCFPPNEDREASPYFHHSYTTPAPLVGGGGPSLAPTGASRGAGVLFPGAAGSEEENDTPSTAIGASKRAASMATTYSDPMFPMELALR